MTKANILCLVVVIILSPLTWGQNINPSKQRLKSHESSFLKEFNLNGEGVAPLILESARGKLDKIESGGIENKVERDGHVFLTRRYETVIGEIDTSVDYALLSGIKPKLQERLQRSGLQFKVSSDYSNVLAIDYESGCTIGSVDIRGIWGEDKLYHLFFIFHESYCKGKS
jgi:hypothetical protein